MKTPYLLSDLRPGQWSVVHSLHAVGSMRRRLLDIGLIPNTTVTCLGRSPGGDPSAYLIRGAVIALRSGDCGKIQIHTPTPCAAWE